MSKHQYSIPVSVLKSGNTLVKLREPIKHSQSKSPKSAQHRPEIPAIVRFAGNNQFRTNKPIMAASDGSVKEGL